MNSKQSAHYPWQGRLPASAPLANPYVPYQSQNPQMHEVPIGFVRGTIYTGLDLPFHGSLNQYPKHQDTMTQLQQAKFAVQEIALYLDTHPNDVIANEKLEAYQKICKEKTIEYEQKYGPLTHLSTSGYGKYQWLDGHWPWEYMR